MSKNTYRVTLPITFTFPEPAVERIFGSKRTSFSNPREYARNRKPSMVDLSDAYDNANGDVLLAAANLLGLDVRTLKNKLGKRGISTDVVKTRRRRRKKRPSKHTMESCVAAAQKFKSRGEWQNNDRNSYAAARRNKWLDICCQHMAPKVKGRPARKQKLVSSVQGFKFDGAMKQ